MEEQMDILIEHSGVAHDENPPGRGSGRYPWGGGDKPFQRPRDFLSRVEYLKQRGLSEKEQAAALGIFSRDSRREYEGSPSRLRTAIRIAQHEEKLDMIREVRALAAQGISATQGARMLGLPNESSFRSYLKEGSEDRAKAARETADDLVKIMEAKGKGLQVGEGVAENLNISQDRLNEALELLYFDGYELYGGRVPQPNNPQHQTTLKILYPPGTPSSAVYDYNSSTSIFDQYISHDGKKIEEGFKYPASMDPKRLMVRYAEEGGIEKDGVVELRPSVKDLYLGDGKHYSQVRILVNGTHYIKGMAVYGDPKDFPDGVDVIFNTNKAKGTPVMLPDKNAKQVLKNIKNDPLNPFNSAIKEHGGQSYWTDDKGEKHLSLINKREDEGGWDGWSKELASQFLSKQPLSLVSRQLDISKKEQREELDKINSLTNDTVKKMLLENFSETADRRAVTLKAASLPGARYQVILPLPSLKDNEIYAPNFKDGETVSLVRFPHAGLFEIPTLTVNNKNPEGIRVITKDAADAVGINANVAKRLSGADFDGDTALVIPHRNGVKVASQPAFQGLLNFDIELEYGDHPGNKHMNPSYQQKQMGVVSNLITDMTLAGAPDQEIERAVKHSMVVIDAVKHGYDYQQSAKDNNIEALKKRWQRKVDADGNIHYGGASTIISQAKNPRKLPYKIEEGQWYTDPKTGKTSRRYIDPETGEKLVTYESTAYRHYMDPVTKERLYKSDTPGMLRTKDGSRLIPKEVAVLSPTKYKYTDVPAMRLTDDAMTLVSALRNPKEIAYAQYANYMKGLANEARKSITVLKPARYNPEAAKAYSEEVGSLKRKYTELQKRKPFETDALVEANSMIKAWYIENPHASSEERGKAKQKIINLCRRQRGLTSYYNSLEITPKEWEAIQAGAIGSSTLTKLLGKADMSIITQYAMPSTKGRLTTAQINRIRSMSASGRTNSEIADALGINVSTVINYTKGEG